MPPLIAIAGNPNVGKTTVFNALTGGRHKIGNYAGVTVEKKVGQLQLAAQSARVVDIPGCFSLNAQSPDEVIAHDVLRGLTEEGAPQLVVIVVNAANLPRNLYVVSQILEFPTPAIIALNMMDLAETDGNRVDPHQLAAELGVPVVPLVATRGTGISDLKLAIEAALARNGSQPQPRRNWRADPAIERELAALADQLRLLGTHPDAAEAEALWLINSLTDGRLSRMFDQRVREAVMGAHERMSAVLKGTTPQEHLIEARYRWIDRVSVAASARLRQSGSLTPRIDRVLLHPVAGFAIFMAVMFLVFQALFAWADPFVGLVESGLGAVTGVVKSVLPAGMFTDLLTQGVLAGVGNILVFLPQILMLFLFLGILEETGYMARAAVLMEGLMRRAGLDGKSFIPLISSFACAIPGIMAARTIEKKEDRLVTILVLPLVSCSARLPVYTLMIGVLFASAPPVFGILNLGGLIMASMYLLSIVSVLAVAFVLKRTLVRSPKPALMLELPPYRLPSVRNLLLMLRDKSWVFISQAGTIILAFTVIMWAMFTFPQGDRSTPQGEEAHLRGSLAGRVGSMIEPVLRPLGFDWKIGMGIIGSFAAREVFVSTMGMVYGVGDDADEQSVSLRDAMRSERRPDGGPVFTPLVGLSVLVFFVLACQCMSTLAVIARETQSWRWPVFVFAYMTVLAYGCSLVVYQGGRLLGYS